MHQLDPEENWSNLLTSFPKGWHGYAGEWMLFGLEGAPANDPIKQWNGARLFNNHGDDTFEQLNVYDQPLGEVQKREQDGHFCKCWPFNKSDGCRADGWWHPWLTESGPLRSRILAPSQSSSGAFCMSLPLAEFSVPPVPAAPAADHQSDSAGAADQPDAGGGAAEAKPKPPVAQFWNSEVYLRKRGSPRSWSGGFNYNLADGSFMAVFLIREALTYEDPTAGPLQLGERPDMWPAQPRLPTDPQQWLADGNWSGSREELLWEGDKVMVVPKRPLDAWQPPPRDNKLLLLPDGLYASFPEALPTAAADIPAAGVTMQFGGLTDGSTFRQSTLVYGADGHIDSASWDTFTKL